MSAVAAPPAPRRAAPAPVLHPRRAGPLRGWLTQAAGVAALLLAWEALVRLLTIPPAILPAPSVIGHQLVQLRASILSAAVYTMSSALAGYVAALVVGVLLGVIFAHWAMLRRGIFPFFVASQAIPVIAFSAVVIL